MCDPSVFLWLQRIRYAAECYEPAPRRPRPAGDAAATVRERDGDGDGDGEEPAAIRHADVRMIPREALFEERAEELAVPRVTVVIGVGEVEPEDVAVWKEEIRYEFSSEEECEELAQQVGVKFCDVLGRKVSAKSVCVEVNG